MMLKLAMTPRVVSKWWLLILAFTPSMCLAQPKSELASPPPLSPAEGERAARTLISNLLAQKPEQNATNTGVLKIRDSDHHEHSVPVEFELLAFPDYWMNTYAAEPAGDQPGEKFAISHAEPHMSEYTLSPIGAGDTSSSGTRKVSGNELMRPFAGSDFWLTDLGLDFLHWPQQRVLKKQMRRNLFCDVLQSTNPNPVPSAYSRVVSWIAVNRPDEIVVVHAEAYDSQDKLLKEFDPKKVQKVNGVWQLEQMEIRNRQTGSRSRIEFNLPHE